MRMKHITGIVVFVGVTAASMPAWAQHGGGHGGGGHSGGGGHAARPVHAGGTRGGGVVGHAVPRRVAPPVVRGRTPLHVTGRRYIAPGHASIGFGLGYPNYRYAYPYGYGYRSPYPYSYGAYGYPPAPAAYGDIRIQGMPTDAQVYVDGYYAGIVDDFDGSFQRLTVEPGPHQIEIAAPGAPPIAFDVNVQSGRTITIRP